MAKKGKQYRDAVQRYDKQHAHTAKEGVELSKSLSCAKFDETLELAARLGVDPRKADQMVRGTVSLPSGTGTEMPNPKTGTVTEDVGRAVGEFKAGKVEYRTDRQGNVHVPVGKMSFEPDALVANIQAVVEELNRARPAAVKGRYFRKITISSTMGPGVRLDPADLGVNR